jgi:hypothetical protein
MGLSDLPTMAQVEANRRGKTFFKGETPSRLDERKADDRDEEAAEKAWRKGCIKRDGKICQACQRKVVQQLALAPERLEVHHIVGRADRVVRWDVRNGVVVCCECHEKLTRHLLFIVQLAKHLFTADNGKTYIDANKKIDFKKAAA